jgi:hypothetical protein
LADFLARDDSAACDALLTLFWRRAVEMRPDLRLIVVRRPLPDVFSSGEGAGFPKLDDAGKLFLVRIASEADAASHHPGAMSVAFSALRSDATSAAVYRFAHGTAPSPGYVRHWQRRNVQAPWRQPPPGVFNLLADLDGGA